MLNVIEVGAEVNIDNSGLALHNCLSHSVYRLMCCPFRSVSIRPRLKVSFEDRLQDELKRPLYHTITNSRNRQNADFLAPVLGNLLLPCPHGPIGVGDQFLPYLLQESFHAAFLDGGERDPVYSRCPVVFFRHLVGCVERVPLADMDVESPESPSWFCLRLDV